MTSGGNIAELEAKVERTVAELTDIRERAAIVEKTKSEAGGDLNETHAQRLQLASVMQMARMSRLSFQPFKPRCLRCTSSSPTIRAAC